MNLFRAMDVSASALTAQRLRLDIIANNLANVDTTRTENGGPYRRQVAVFASRTAPSAFAQTLSQAQAGANNLGGVYVTRIDEDQTPFKLRYDPGNPDADAEGYVRMPNVNTVTEMVDMISATRAYEANITAINSAKAMISQALQIGKR